MMKSSMHIQSISPKKSPHTVEVERNIAAVRNNNKGDRISSLPDDLLYSILSYLPMKSAIRTSILSPRWKYLWTCNPTFMLEYDHNLPALHFDGAMYKKFMNMVDSLCHPNQGKSSCVQHFRVWSYQKTFVKPDLSRWISFLSTGNIKEFELKLENNSLCQMPSTLFTCKSLVVLKLNGFFQLNLPTTISFPSLKTLLLESIIYSSEASLERLLSACPVLRFLRVVITEWDVTWILNISVPSLKQLWLQFQPLDFDVEKIMFTTRISAPNLEYLKLHDYGSKYISLNSMPSLVEAHVDFMTLTTSPLDFEGRELVLAISGVKFLSLDRYAMDSLRKCYGLHHHLPVFRNVVKLWLGLDKSPGWEFVVNLLQSLPKLHVLVFQQGLFDPDSPKNDLRAPVDVPVCLSSCLKIIEVRGFREEEDELILLAYLLENAKVLENLNVYCTHNHHDGLQQLVDRSSSCKLTFIHWKPYLYY